MKWIKYMGIFVAGLFVGLAIDGLLKGYISLDSFKYINNNFANILGFLANLMMVIVTVIYVIFTYKLTTNSETTTKLAEKSAEYSKQAASANVQMVESMHQQLKQSNHPCIIPNIIGAFGTRCLSGDHRQLNIDLELRNTGNGPALSVYAFAWLKPKYLNFDSDQLIPMYFLPGYKPTVSVEEKCTVHVKFGPDAIKYLLNDLEKAYELNTIRVKTDPSKSVFLGTDLVIKVYYKNISDQWYEVTYVRIINGLKSVLYDASLNEYVEVNPDETNSKIKTKRVPPENLLPIEGFEMDFISELFSTLNVKLISSDTIISLLKNCDEELNNHLINLSEGKKF